MKKLLISGIALLAMMLAVIGAYAAEQVSMEASVGYDGAILNGRWYPIELQMNNEGDAFEGVLSIDLMQSAETYDRFTYPVTLQAGETETVHFPISTLIPQRTFDISLCAGGEVIAQTSVSAAVAVSDEAILVGVLGENAALAQSMNVSSRNDVLGRQETIASIRVDEALFALSEKELSAFQVLVFDGVDIGALEPAKLQMLEDWVRRGGILLTQQQSSASWIASQTGVRAGQPVTSESVLESLLAYANTAHSGKPAQMQVTPLSADDQGIIFDAQGRCLMAKASFGSGLILVCGFDMSDALLLKEAEENALWQRLLLAAEPDLYNDLFNNGRRANYQYGSSLNEQQVIGRGESILPVLLTLCAYVLAAGCGLFLLFGRHDRSKQLWVWLPAAAAAGAVAVVGLAAMLDMDLPTAASFRVTHYDQNGVAYVEERALVAYADQDRVTITAENGEAIERLDYGYFYSGAEKAEVTTHRDTLLLGESNGIELSPVAPWLPRNLVIYPQSKPEGSVTGSVWMEEGGLCAEVANGTDTKLQNAMLFTSLGYVSIGDLKPGETRLVRIEKTGEIVKKENGDQAILENTLLEYPVSLSSVVRASVYPQEETNPEFDTSQLDGAAAQMLSIERYKRNLAYGMEGEQRISCVLYAESPELSCLQLYKDSEPIIRRAEESVLTASMRFETEGRTGYAYYPLGTFEARSVSLKDQSPVMGKPAVDRYADVSEEGVYFGFDLSGVKGVEVESIKIVSDYYRAEDMPLYLEVYDCQLEDWVRLSHPGQVEMDASITARVLDEKQQLFIRYMAGDERQGGTVYLPQIIVEGSVQP